MTKKQIMTKKISYIISFVIMTMAFAVAAAAQLPSLANVGDDVYISEADGFEIAIPEGCVEVVDGEDGREYRCEVKEGNIKVTIDPNNPEIKSDTDLAAFLKGFKESLAGNPDVKFFGETNAKIGNYSGAAYQLTIGGEKTLVIVLAWSKFAVVISGRANSKVANSAELIGGAVQSFTFVSPTTK